MGELHSNMLHGVKCRSSMLLAADEEQVSGKVLVSWTKKVNRANWQFPNFIDKAYGDKASADFLFSMHVTMPKGLSTAKFYKQLAANAKEYVAKRDADAFLHLMAGEPSNYN